MASRPAAASLCVALIAVALVVSIAAPAQADQRLQNGGLEQGAAGWNGNFSVSGCASRSGAAVALSQSAWIQQAVAGAVGPGSYTFTAFAATQGGAARLRLILEWQSGGQIAQVPHEVAVGPTYAQYAVQGSPNSTVTGLVVRAVNVGGPGVICLDDLALEAPPPPQATSTPQPTSTTVVPASIAASVTPSVALVAASTPTPAAPPRSPTPVPATATVAATPPGPSPTAATTPITAPSTPQQQSLSPQANLNAAGATSTPSISAPAAVSGAASTRPTATPAYALAAATGPAATSVAEVDGARNQRPPEPLPTRDEPTSGLELPGRDTWFVSALLMVACTGGTMYLSKRWRP